MLVQPFKSYIHQLFGQLLIDFKEDISMHFTIFQIRNIQE